MLKRMQVFSAILISVLFSAWALPASAAQNLSSAQSAVVGNNNNAILREPPTVIPPAPDIDAKGYVLMDAQSGRILAKKNMNERMQPASLTKMMTSYVISEALKQGQIRLSDQVRISKNAWSRGGSRMFLKLGSHIPVRLLIEGIIVASGNDACVAMAEYIAGNEKSFAQLMNMTAKRLGMNNTHYTDSTGLPMPGHYSTPHDIAVLTRHLINDFPEDYKWYKQKWIKFNGIKQPNRNRLLWRDPNVDGVKTGHTKAAGYCLVSSAKHDGMRLISVVMGAPSDHSRSDDSQALLNWGFRFYKTFKLFDANSTITKPRVWSGKNKYTPMGVIKPLYVTIPIGQEKGLKASVSLQPKIEAPIKKGQQCGTVDVTLYGKPLKKAPLVALQSDSKGGLWTRMTDGVAKLFHKWF